MPWILFEGLAVTFRGVLLFVAVLCTLLPSAAIEAASVAATPNALQATPHRVASPFGIPFPDSRDPQAWQAWRQRVKTELDARRSTRARTNDAGATGGGIIETIAGAAPFQKPVNALKTGFGNIDGVAEDSSGNLYVASCDLGTILKIDPSSNTTVFAGKPLSIAAAAAAGDGGSAKEARLPCPAGVVVDSANNVYVSDTVSDTVRKIDAGTGTIHTIAGVSGEAGHSGDGGPATSALFESPTGLALDGAGNLFIADLSYIRRLDLASGIIQTLAGTVGPPQCQLTASSTCPGSQVSFETFGETIAFANGLLYGAPAYLSVGSSSAFETGAIISIDSATGVVRLLAGGGVGAGRSSSYPAVGLELDPQGIAVDAAGNVYITGLNQPPATGAGPDTSASFPLIEELQTSDYSLHVVAGVPSTSPGYSGDGGPAINATLYSPATICISPTGKLVFVDFFNIRSFPVGGNITTIAGNGSGNFFGDSGQAQQAGLDQTSGVTADSQGDVYIADRNNGRVRKIGIATGVITTVAGGGIFYGAAGDGGPALQAALFPTDVVLDNSNHLYIRDYLYGLRVVDLTEGTISTLVPNVTTSGPMLFDGDHTLYIGAPHNPVSVGPLIPGNDQVRAVDLTSGAMTVIAGQGQLSGLPSGDGDPATMANLSNVMGLALDGKGHLFLADSGFSDVRQIDLGTGIISTIASSHPDVGFTRGYSGDGGPATNATLNFPTGLAYDGAGNLTIADSENHVLRQIDLATNIITTTVGNHTPGFAGDGGSPTSAMLYRPNAVAYGPEGNLLIADQGNDRVRRVVAHPKKLASALTYGDAITGNGIQWTATYSGLSFGIAPTGTVTLSSGGTSLGSGTLSAAATDGSPNYVATITTTSTPAEGAKVTAQYSGDGNYAAATTNTTFQQPTPSYTVSAKPASLTIKQGSSGSVAFTVTPQNGFDQAVSFHCDSATLPAGVSCGFSPASVTPDGSTAVTTTLTVQTSGAGIAALDRRTKSLFGPSSCWLPRSGACWR